MKRQIHHENGDKSGAAGIKENRMANCFLHKTPVPIIIEAVQQMHPFFKLLILILAVAFFVTHVMERYTVKGMIRRMARGRMKVSPKKFLRIRNETGHRQKDSRRYISAKYDFAGVYVIYNKTQRLYYVGQANKVLQRVNSHFTGHGNGDVYADFSYGDRFSIRTIRLRGSGCATLNELERKYIKKYDAFGKGYNRTAGNKG